jgi:hypothetical protein
MAGTSQWIFSPQFKVLVAAGKVPGWRRFRKFGMNGAVASGTEQMWPPGTVKTLPTSAAVAAVSSDSAEDDPDEATPPGTGAWTVVVEGLDANYVERSETVTMTGTTPANTTQTFLRVFRAYVATAGTAGTNVGNISISVGGNLQSYIEATEGQTHQTDFCVPADHTWLVDTYDIGVGRMAGTSDLHILGQIRTYGGAWRTITDIWLYNGQGHHNGDSVTAIPAKTDVRQLIVSSVASQAHGIIDGYLVRNSALALE